MESKSFHTHSVKEAQDHIEQTIQAGFQPDLAIVFGSIEHDLDAFRAYLNQKGMEVFGASSAGEILERGNDHTVYDRALVIMLIKLDRAAFKVNLFDGGDLTSLDLGQKVGAWAKDVFENPALLVMASGMQTDGEQILRGIMTHTGENVPVYGGLAGDDTRLQATFVFDKGTYNGKGAVVLAFDQAKIAVGGVAACGWKAVGGVKTITKSEGNVVYSIDNRPVTDVYREYLGMTENTSLTLTAEYPLQIIRQEGYEVMRAALVVNHEQKIMIYAGSLPEGAKVRFCVPPGTEIIDHALREIRDLNQQVPDVDVLILFSCKGRHLALGPMAEDEIKPMQALWNAPLIGFYTYGEFGKTRNGKLDFHNETCVLVTLKEK